MHHKITQYCKQKRDVYPMALAHKIVLILKIKVKIEKKKDDDNYWSGKTENDGWWLVAGGYHDRCYFEIKQAIMMIGGKK